MPSPTCQVKDGSGSFASTTNGCNVTPANTVTIGLVSTAGVSSWGLSCIGTDDLNTVALVNAGLTIDTTTKTATFTAPAAGRAMIFQSVVNGGVDINGRAQSSYTTTFGVYTLTNGGGLRVHALNETFESNASTGWVGDINSVIRGNEFALSLASNFTTTAATATATALSFAVKNGEVWFVDYSLTAQCSSTGGVKFSITAPTSSTIEGWLDGTTTTITTLSRQRITAISTLTGTAIHTVATTPAPDRIWARVACAADGVITLNAASGTAAQTTTIFAGSAVRALRSTAL